MKKRFLLLITTLIVAGCREANPRSRVEFELYYSCEELINNKAGAIFLCRKGDLVVNVFLMPGSPPPPAR